MEPVVRQEIEKKAKVVLRGEGGMVELSRIAKRMKVSIPLSVAETGKENCEPCCEHQLQRRLRLDPDTVELLG